MVHTEGHCDYLHQDSHRENVLDSKTRGLNNVLANVLSTEPPNV
jgi:streptomycin 6-kinase